MENLKLINVNEIYQHPDNPRKDLGDLSELSDSIKSVGILQNLTVVPGHTMTEDEYISLCKSEGISKSTAKANIAADPECLKAGTGYTVIIGHRRLAAAKQAGVKEVPCVIADMDYKEQIRTMMMENMQRQDLTILEQADGFQMMIDLGDSIKAIAKDTGFSQQTIKHRVKLLDLDRERLTRTMSERPIKMDELIKLEAVKDQKEKNWLIDRLGTSNFQYDLQTVLSKQKWKKAKEEIIKILKEKGINPVPEDVNLFQLTWECLLNTESLKNGELDLKLGDYEEHYYRVSPYYNNIEVYGKPNVSAEPEEDDEKDSEKSKTAANIERAQLIQETISKIYKLHDDFLIEKFKGGFAKMSMWDLKEIAIAFIKEQLDFQADEEQFVKDFLKINFEYDCGYDAVLEILPERPLDVLLMYMLLIITRHAGNPYYCQSWGDHSITYRTIESVMDMRDMLEALGYDAGDEEERFYNGGFLENEQPGDKEVSDSE